VHFRLRVQGAARQGRRRWPLQISVVDEIHELLVAEEAVEKLGARSISVEEAQQLLDNRYLILRDPGRRRRREQGRARRLVIGRTNGGRALTLVVERTREPTTWLIVTGWGATPRERKILGG
jgi:uncharacterized DUF497 family protein